MIASPWMPLLRKAARSYVAGPELQDAVRLAKEFAARGVPASTLCFWDATDDIPRHVADMYLATVRAIQGARLDSYVSVKAPSLAFDARFGRGDCGGRARRRNLRSLRLAWSGDGRRYLPDRSRTRSP